MSQTLLAKRIDDAKRLTDEERDALRRTLEQWPPKPSQPAMTEDELDQELVASGFLWSAPPLDESGEPEERRLITIKGKPLSETIIEERR